MKTQWIAKGLGAALALALAAPAFADDSMTSPPLTRISYSVRTMLPAVTFMAARLQRDARPWQPPRARPAHFYRRGSRSHAFCPHAHPKPCGFVRTHSVGTAGGDRGNGPSPSVK